MKNKITSTWAEDTDLLGPESCEEGLGFLAYVLREDIAEGRDLDTLEIESMRSVASELLVLAATWLRQQAAMSLSPLDDKAVEQRAARLFEVVRQVLCPRTPPFQLAHAFQSAADLIRSSRRHGFVSGRAKPN